MALLLAFGVSPERFGDETSFWLPYLVRVLDAYRLGSWALAMRIVRDLWTVRDDRGLLHRAQVRRAFDSNDELFEFAVATACAPVFRVRKRHGDPVDSFTLPWGNGKTKLPAVVFSLHRGLFTVIEYYVKDAPTCMPCLTVVLPAAFARKA